MSANTNPPTPPLDGQEEASLNKLIEENKYRAIPPNNVSWDHNWKPNDENAEKREGWIIGAKWGYTAALTQANDRVKELEGYNAKLESALMHLHKALPPILITEKFEGIDTERAEIVKTAVEGAARVLEGAFSILGLKTHIESTVEFPDKSEKYKLSLTKINP